MTPSAPVVLVVGYAVFLVATAWGFDLMSRRVARRSNEWRTGRFVYHEDHDAWLCPEDQWLWPQSFDPHHRVMRYRALPTVCNSCPVKSTCTTSAHGREVTREYDAWPHSEAGRFHRGIALLIAVIAGVLPLLMLITARSLIDAATLAATVAFVVLAGVPLARHLWNTPSAFPEHISQDLVYRPVPMKDRYQTTWGTRGEK